MTSIRGSDPRISWHKKSDFGQSVCECPSVGASPGAKGSWGECVARNYLIAHGVDVVRHAVFRLPGHRVIVDLYHPPSMSAFEVKTGARSNSPLFQTRIHVIGLLRQEGMIRRAAFINVNFRGSVGFSMSLKHDLLNAGIEIMTLDVSSTCSLGMPGVRHAY